MTIMKMDYTIGTKISNLTDVRNGASKKIDPRSFRAFLCHAAEDKNEVHQLYQQLLSDGFSPWLDTENLLPGQDWKREIQRVVTSSDVVIIRLSLKAVSKAGFIRQEIDLAIDVAYKQRLPRAQHNERSALTLLAPLDLMPDKDWAEATAPLCGITPMMDFFAQHYGKQYKPNTRETVRRQTVHQSLDAGLLLENPDNPDRPVNSPKAVYQVETSTLELLRLYGTPAWDAALRTYLISTETLQCRYAQEREMRCISVRLPSGQTVTLSPGGQNVLIEQIIRQFAERFTPDGEVLYIGDADEKFALFDKQRLRDLGITVNIHGKIPDVVIYHTEKQWLVLIEAVTSHGPVNPKRHKELSKLFQGATVGLVYVTAFLTRKALKEYLHDVSWETEVWIAEAPDHMIHFNGERFLGPYTK